MERNTVIYLYGYFHRFPHELTVFTCREPTTLYYITQFLSYLIFPVSSTLFFLSIWKPWVLVLFLFSNIASLILFNNSPQCCLSTFMLTNLCFNYEFEAYPWLHFQAFHNLYSLHAHPIFSYADPVWCWASFYTLPNCLIFPTSHLFLRLFSRMLPKAV